MTEDEWLTSNRGPEMLNHLGAKATARKRALLVAYCVRRLSHLFPESRQQYAVSVLERMAEGVVSTVEINTAKHGAHSTTTQFGDRLHFAGTMLFREFVSSNTGHHALLLPGALADGTPENAHLCLIVRDIFVNPFRPVSFNPAWRTDTAVAVARQMYDSRDFGAMPILADALQEAGCEDEQVLTHCR